jgi:hypoxanthine phosphoribosyltransferase
MQKRIVTFDEFKGLVQEICRQIAKDNWRPDYIVGLTRGGLLPATMISHYLEVPMQSLDVSLGDGGECVSNLGMVEDAFNGKNILIVDDINDQGSTINWIKQDWPSGCFPESEIWDKVWGNNVRWAVVFDNLASLATVEMTYVGEEINKAEQDLWIEFPYENWWK